MNGAQHTPGPWTPGQRYIFDSSGRVLLEVAEWRLPFHAPNTANLTLAAAAPTMLAALVLAERVLKVDAEDPALDHTECVADIALREVRTAINAARGRR